MKVKLLPYESCSRIGRAYNQGRVISDEFVAFMLPARLFDSIIEVEGE